MRDGTSAAGSAGIFIRLRSCRTRSLGSTRAGCFISRVHCGSGGEVSLVVRFCVYLLFCPRSMLVRIATCMLLMLGF